MRMYDLLEKKKHGGALSGEEIRFMIDGYTKGTIPDYQMSAMTMAIYFQGMTDQETGDLTLAMRDSGAALDLSGIKGIKVDKHSTGGVGDKVSLALAPLVSSVGVKVAKMSGRGLGHTGGTIDKLESDLKDAKYKALSSSSTLTAKSRESHVLEVLKQNKDSLLHQADQPPYIIEVPE